MFTPLRSKQDKELQIIEVLFAFANQKTLNPADVEKLIEPFFWGERGLPAERLLRHLHAETRYRLAILAGDKNAEDLLPAFSPRERSQNEKDDEAAVRDRRHAAAYQQRRIFTKTSRSALLEEISYEIDLPRTVLIRSPRKRGRDLWTVRYQPQNIKELLNLGVTLLIRYDLLSKLHKCKNRECKSVVLRDTLGRRGAADSYCSDECRREAKQPGNNDRQQRFRDRKKKQREEARRAEESSKISNAIKEAKKRIKPERKGV